MVTMCTLDMMDDKGAVPLKVFVPKTHTHRENNIKQVPVQEHSTKYPTSTQNGQGHQTLPSLRSYGRVV